MTPIADFSSADPRLTIGIVVENSHQNYEDSIRSARHMSQHIFLLDVSSGHAAWHSDVLPPTRKLALDSCEDFAAAKNELIEMIENEGNDHDWLLWMSAGEIFDEDVAPSFFDFLQNDAEKSSLYVMVQHRLFQRDRSRHDFDEESIDARLMPLKKGLRFENPVCPTLYPAADRLKIAVDAAPGRLLTFVDSQETLWRRERAEKMLTLLKKLEQTLSTPKKPFPADDALLLRGECYGELEDYLAARRDFESVIEQTAAVHIQLEAYYRLWETFSSAPIAATEMTKVLLAGIDRFPVDMQLLTFMGSHLQRQGQLDLAIRTFQTAVQHGRISLDTTHRLHIGEMAILSLALAHRLKGEPKEAIRVLEANGEHIADRSKYHQQLLDLYIAEEAENKALDLAALIWGDQELDTMRSVLSAACHAAGGHWKSAVEPLEKAYKNGCQHMICLRWLAMTQLALLRFTDAVPVLEDWAKREPENAEPKALLTATRKPEMFHETLGNILVAQRKKLGLPPQTPPTNGKKQSTLPGLEEIISEMIISSGTLPENQIRLGPSRKSCKAT